ncbi:MAG: putative peptidase [Chlamydiia bacterium]|nr:putative peptidase [Chlamydiia bacterium]
MQNERIKKVREGMKEEGIDCLCVEDPILLYYFLGIQVSFGMLFIHEDREVLFADSRYFDALSQVVQVPLVRYRGDVTVKEHFPIPPDRLGVDGSRCTYSRFKQLASLFPDSELVDCDLTTRLRMIKDPDEIVALQRSCDVNYQAYTDVRGQLEVGMREVDVANLYERRIRELGASGASFDPMVCFSNHSACPHHKTGEATLEEGTLVLLDVGCMVDHYASDLTRTFGFGEINPSLEEVYAYVKEMNEELLEMIRPGVPLLDVVNHYNGCFSAKQIEERNLHSLGHGVGMEVHESPSMRPRDVDGVVFEEGMVLAIEPGCYIKDVGGVRIENMVEVTSKGVRNFYPSLVD